MTEDGGKAKQWLLEPHESNAYRGVRFGFGDPLRLPPAVFPAKFSDF